MLAHCSARPTRWKPRWCWACVGRYRVTSTIPPPANATRRLRISVGLSLQPSPSSVAECFVPPFLEGLSILRCARVPEDTLILSVVLHRPHRPQDLSSTAHGNCYAGPATRQPQACWVLHSSPVLSSFTMPSPTPKPMSIKFPSHP